MTTNYSAVSYVSQLL